MNGVGLTSLWVAAMRAVESEREDGLFKDPFARKLAGERGFEVLAAMDPGIGPPRPPTIAVRTWFIDDRIARADARQVVILAAGMDARAYRLNWASGTIVYELDQPEVLAYKREKLEGAEPRCERRELPIDLSTDWTAPLRERGFDPAARTLWLVEGLLPYLRAEHVSSIFARVDALSSTGSVVLFDCLGQSVLDSPYMTTMLAAVAKLGAPWQFGTEHPESLLAPLGWDVEVNDIAAIGRSFGRWPYPAAPRGTPGVPQSFLVAATKR